MVMLQVLRCRARWKKLCSMQSYVFFLNLQSGFRLFLYLCSGCVECRALEYKYPSFSGIDNLEGLPKCVVHLLDVCKFILSYLISSLR